MALLFLCICFQSSFFVVLFFLWCITFKNTSLFFVLRGPILNIWLQHGQNSPPSQYMKTSQWLHLFCPETYLPPSLGFVALYLSQRPLQTMPMNNHHSNYHCAYSLNTTSWNLNQVNRIRLFEKIPFCCLLCDDIIFHGLTMICHEFIMDKAYLASSNANVGIDLSGSFSCISMSAVCFVRYVHYEIESWWLSFLNCVKSFSFILFSDLLLSLVCCLETVLCNLCLFCKLDCL